jgi:hypothetical protein
MLAMMLLNMSFLSIKLTSYNAKSVSDGFRTPIVMCFGEDWRSLSRLASNNANQLKPEYFASLFLKNGFGLELKSFEE